MEVKKISKVKNGIFRKNILKALGVLFVTLINCFPNNFLVKLIICNSLLCNAYNLCIVLLWCVGLIYLAETVVKGERLNPQLLHSLQLLFIEVLQLVPAIGEDRPEATVCHHKKVCL